MSTYSPVYMVQPPKPTPPPSGAMRIVPQKKEEPVKEQVQETVIEPVKKPDPPQVKPEPKKEPKVEPQKPKTPEPTKQPEENTPDRSAECPKEISDAIMNDVIKQYAGKVSYSVIIT